MSSRDPGGRARGRVLAGAELGGGDEVVLDHRVFHVRRGNPHGVGEDGRNPDLRHGVHHRAVHQRRRRVLPGTQVHRQRGGGAGLEVDRLVDRAALVAGQDVLQADLARRPARWSGTSSA